jgi:hypothetical protein
MPKQMQSDDWHELMRDLPVTPLSLRGELLSRETLVPGTQLRIVEERGDELLLEARGSAPSEHWRYIAARADFERALTRPGNLPREGGVTIPPPTGGSPD